MPDISDILQQEAWSERARIENKRRNLKDNPDAVLEALRKKQPDANERESWLVSMLIGTYPYIPPNLIHVTSGLATRGVILRWLKENYGLDISFPEDFA